MATAVADQTDEQDPNVTTQPKKATAVPGTPISVANVPPVATNPVTPNVPQLAPISAASAAQQPGGNVPDIPAATATPAQAPIPPGTQQAGGFHALPNATAPIGVNPFISETNKVGLNPAGLNPDGSIKDPILANSWQNGQNAQQNAAQVDVDRINSANDTYYNRGGTWNGTDEGRLYANGVEGGAQWDAATGKFDLPAAWTGDVNNPTWTGAKPQGTPGFGVALAGNPIQAGQTLAQDSVDHTLADPTARPGIAAGGPSVNPIPMTGATAPSPTSILRAGTPTGSATAPAVSTAPTLTPTDPGNPLTAQTISTNPTANRFSIANQQLQDTIHNTLDPQFKADMLAADAHDFGQGRGVSGMHRTGIGNLELAKANNENQLASSFLNPALAGTISDQENAASRAERQQTFQKSQQDDLFGQNVTTKQLEDQLTNSAANRAAQQSAIGEQNSPAQVQLILSQIASGQSAQASSAAATALRNAGIDSKGMTPQQIMSAYIKYLSPQSAAA